MKRAVNAFYCGLRRIPSYGFAFLLYLWRSLVVPVGLYGAELLQEDAQQCREMFTYERRCWRNLLHVGGRAPNDLIHTLMGLPSLEYEVRLRTAIFLAKL
eukprot:10113985-Karenia_brevis.AAC.1